MSNKAKIAKYRAIINSQHAEIEKLRTDNLYLKSLESSKDFIVDLIGEIEENRRELEALKDKLSFYEQDMVTKASIYLNKYLEEVEHEMPEFKDAKELNDEYFRNLSLKHIAGLAKKSIRITAENCEQLHKLEDLSEILDTCSDETFKMKAREIIGKLY